MRRGDSTYVAPRWQIVPPGGVADADAFALWLYPGAGFGDGRHPTTQLCLQAIFALAPRGAAWRLLDFGSGSAVLSIAAAAHLGATADAVEIDAGAIEHAKWNVQANGVEGAVRPFFALGETEGCFEIVVANVLRDVLLSFAEGLVVRVARGGALVLSGLVSTDVPAVIARYVPQFGGARPEIYERGDWRALVWRAVPGAQAR